MILRQISRIAECLKMRSSNMLMRFNKFIEIERFPSKNSKIFYNNPWTYSAKITKRGHEMRSDIN